MENTKITIETTINAPIVKIWECWTEPKHIQQWNNASDDWHTPFAGNDLQAGGKFLSRMEAKDGSFGFDFEGTYNLVKPLERIEYTLADNRKVQIEFIKNPENIRVIETFEAETTNPIEMQQTGWQAILNNFKAYVNTQV